MEDKFVEFELKNLVNEEYDTNELRRIFDEKPYKIKKLDPTRYSGGCTPPSRLICTDGKYVYTTSKSGSSVNVFDFNTFKLLLIIGTQYDPESDVESEKELEEKTEATFKKLWHSQLVYDDSDSGSDDEVRKAKYNLLYAKEKHKYLKKCKKESCWPRDSTKEEHGDIFQHISSIGYDSFDNKLYIFSWYNSGKIFIISRKEIDFHIKLNKGIIYCDHSSIIQEKSYSFTSIKGSSKDYLHDLYIDEKYLYTSYWGEWNIFDKQAKKFNIPIKIISYQINDNWFTQNQYLRNISLVTDSKNIFIMIDKNTIHVLSKYNFEIVSVINVLTTWKSINHIFHRNNKNFLIISGESNTIIYKLNETNNLFTLDTIASSQKGDIIFNDSEKIYFFSIDENGNVQKHTYQF